MAIATKQLSTHQKTCYDHDFYAWTQEQSHLLRTEQLQLIDIQNLAEEIEDMGRAEKHELESHLEILLMHLLKWQFQPSHRSRSWQLTIKEQQFSLWNESTGFQRFTGLLIIVKTSLYKGFKDLIFHNENC